MQNKLIQEFKDSNEKLFFNLVKKENILAPAKGKVIRHQIKSSEYCRVSYL